MPYPTRARKKRRSCSSAGKDTGPPRPRVEPSTLRSAGSEAAQADSSKLPRSSVALGEDRVATCVQTGLYLCRAGEPAVDRKSTRLNSSHQIISYAVFCLKKKKESTQL